MYKLEILVNGNGEKVLQFLEGVLAVAMAMLAMVGIEVTASAVVECPGDVEDGYNEDEVENA